MNEENKEIGLGGKIFLWIIGIILVGSLIVSFISELFGPNGPLFAIILILVTIIFGVYIEKNR